MSSSTNTTTQEAVMGQPFPTQHPAVVLRSHFKLVRSLLAVAMAALVALSATVVILANDDDELTGRIAQPADLPALPNSAVHSHPLSGDATRYDGGPEEGTRGAVSAASVPNGARYDGGPEEGTRDLGAAATVPNGARYDGGPEEGSASIANAGGSTENRPVVIPQGPGGPR
jgi:hypothetical protein